MSLSAGRSGFSANADGSRGCFETPGAVWTPATTPALPEVGGEIEPPLPPLARVTFKASVQMNYWDFDVTTQRGAYIAGVASALGRAEADVSIVFVVQVLNYRRRLLKEYVEVETDVLVPPGEAEALALSCTCETLNAALASQGMTVSSVSDLAVLQPPGWQLANPASAESTPTSADPLGSAEGDLLVVVGAAASGALFLLLLCCVAIVCLCVRRRQSAKVANAVPVGGVEPDAVTVVTAPPTVTTVGGAVPVVVTVRGAVPDEGQASGAATGVPHHDVVAVLHDEVLHHGVVQPGVVQDVADFVAHDLRELYEWTHA